MLPDSMPKSTRGPCPRYFSSTQHSSPRYRLLLSRSKAPGFDATSLPAGVTVPLLEIYLAVIGKIQYLYAPNGPGTFLGNSIQYFPCEVITLAVVWFLRA
jgi:hypothetical protein